MTTTPPATARLIEQGRGLARQGRHADALALYESVLATAPGSALAHHCRANSLLATGRVPDAVAGYDRAVALDPALADAWNNRGCALQALGRHGEAIDSFARAMTLSPTDADARFNRANSLRATGDTTAALDAYEAVLKLAPGHAGALANKAAMLAETGRGLEALPTLDALVANAPQNGQWLLLRGGVLNAVGRYSDARRDFEAALTKAPQLPQAVFGRARARIGLGLLAEALADLDGLLAAEPGNAKAWTNRGLAQSGLGDMAGAIASYDKALVLDPRLVQAHLNKAAASMAQHAYDKALASYQSALELEPGSRDAQSGSGLALRALCRHAEAARAFDVALEGDRLDAEALGGRLLVALEMCDWDAVEAHTQTVSDNLVAIDPLTAVRLGVSPAVQLAISKAESARFQPAPAGTKPATLTRKTDRRLTIGYLSSDLGAHAVGYQISEMIERHDRTRFKIVGFPASPPDDNAFERRILGAFDAIEPVYRLDDRTVDRAIRSQGVDILVDLNGHTIKHRLSALAGRPAPIQATYIGFPGTLGADFIDYVIADRVVLPEEEARYFSEQPVWLPDCYQVSDTTHTPGVAPTRTSEGLPERGFVFACFNATHKITRPVWDVWMRLLQAVEGSVLWLVASNGEAEKNLRLAAGERGVAPDRLVFCRHVAAGAHLARQPLADIFLDTLPYNAHGTASLALRVGLPILTCPGSTFCGRVSASLLGCLGMPELIASSLADYETKALALAREPGAAAAMKARLARAIATSPLFDTVRFTRHLERAYEEMAAIHSRGEKPRPISVERMA